ncbi:MAG TPA: selenocysteine-specific translation elongation factor [Terriglobales bacterium]|nr:selenocysteine-specific translation elongation factor [Terriglobales bacterium]
MARVIGTAGHIDHGKTALVRALTGIDTDRLAEEKRRGISIDLGFAHLDIGGERIAIIDVPGHERFIKNMLAGAHGVGLGLLVVAADDGVMPQTEEHLDILRLLAVPRGVIAISKIDLVDPAQLAAVRRQLATLTAGTSFAAAPVLKVSAVTGAGIEALRQCLSQQWQSLTPLPEGGYFRLPVDRVFTLRGHGTVVTGTAVSGTVRPGDLVRVLPGTAELRVRAVQSHGVELGAARAGQRVALNVSGAGRATIGRGQVLGDCRLDRATDRFDAVLLGARGGPPWKSHLPVRVHVGTAAVLGKVILLPAAAPDSTAVYAQVVLREPIALSRADRFVLRLENGSRTAGGGMVLHPFARRHRRGDGAVQALPQLDAAQSAEALIAALLAYAGDDAIDVSDLAQASGLLPEELVAAARTSTALRLLPDARQPTAITDLARWQALRCKVLEVVEAAHRAPPAEPGFAIEWLRSRVAPRWPAKRFQLLIEELLGEGALLRERNVLRLTGHSPPPGGVLGREAERLLALLTQAQFSPPDLRELAAAAEIASNTLLPLLRELVRAGQVVKVDESLYYAAPAIASARDRVRAEIDRTGSITAARLRDLLGVSRKFSIALLDYFDRTGFTMRIGDLRKLHPKSRS